MGREQALGKNNRYITRKTGIKDLGALWTGKLLKGASHLSGMGGTTLPGRAAIALSPELLPHLAGQLNKGSLIVTGTNGKTTTSYLLASIFRHSGLKVIHNHTGSNLAWGVASTLINAGTWTGRLPFDLGIIESDEGAFPGVVKALAPRGAVVTNIFRDQLDRYGEVDRILSMIKRGLDALPKGSPVALNADDPSLVYLEQSQTIAPVYYGFSLMLPQRSFLNTGQDLKACPLCGQKLTYSVIHFAHLGRYRCPSCRFRRPEPTVQLIDLTLHNLYAADLSIKLAREKITFHYALPGVYNLYNALAAAACAYAWGVPAEDIAAGLEQATPSFGRMEQFELNGCKALMGLVKNPVGANEVLRTFLEIPGRFNLLIAISDNYADGTDISWLWDVDFEQLDEVSDRFSTVTVSGIRAADMGVRLKYAGLDPSRILVVPSLKDALNQCLRSADGDEPLYILPTYTAMLKLRRIINRMGAAKPYWEE